MALTLAGSNDVVVQSIHNNNGDITAVSGGYTDFTLQSGIFVGTANLKNTTTGTAPTWTSGSATAAGSAIAIKVQ